MLLYHLNSLSEGGQLLSFVAVFVLWDFYLCITGFFLFQIPNVLVFPPWLLDLSQHGCCHTSLLLVCPFQNGNCISSAPSHSSIVLINFKKISLHSFTDSSQDNEGLVQHLQACRIIFNMFCRLMALDFVARFSPPDAAFWDWDLPALFSIFFSF